MKASRRRRTLMAAWVVLGAAVVGSPAAWAEPDSSPVDAPVDAPSPVPADAVPVADTAPSSEACKQFSVALNYAATNYEDFAYNTAGNGNIVNYDDPSVQDSNVTGRTALRQAAASAWSASNIPGVTPDVSGPIQSWSLHATKLVFIMGLRGGGDSLNNTATDLNTDAHNAQMACAMAGTPA